MDGTMLRRIVVLTIALFVLASPCLADAGTMTLEKMIQRSKFIVLAKVVRVKFVDGVKLAELEVTRTLKGDPSVTRLYYWATPSWMCDVSDATLNEVGIYFLWEVENPSPNKAQLRFQRRARPFTQGATIYALEHSGRGRLRPRYIDGAGYLYTHKFSDVIFPTSIEIVRRPEPKDPDLGMVRLDDVLSFILLSQNSGVARPD